MQPLFEALKLYSVNIVQSLNGSQKVGLFMSNLAFNVFRSFYTITVLP